MTSDNSIVVDLNKVQYAKLVYRNQFKDYVEHKPKQPTSRAVCFEPNDVCLGSTLRPPETMIEYAKRNDLLDRWTPVLFLQLTANHSLVYTSDKAISLWEAWCKRIFKKK